MPEPSKNMPPLMILCGGKGTRLRDISELIPKPLVPIGTQPILWHIMRSYSVFGVKRFLLCLGYKREDFIDYFMNFRACASDVTIQLGSGNLTFHDPYYENDWEVTLIQTGQETLTGTRVLIASKYLRKDDESFFLTYGDGVSDVNIDELYRYHRKTGRLMTITAVHPEGRFGEMKIRNEQVLGFMEKRTRTQGYVNGGYMVIDRPFVSQYLSEERDEYLEAGPISRVVEDGQLSAYKHEGFWQCMDTPREYQLLNELWQEGKSPWTKWW